MTRLNSFRVAAFCAALTAPPSIAAADVIVLMADEWCPYNCEPTSENPGFMVEITREALAPFGHQVDYQTLNWARSLHRAALGEINGVIGAVPEEAPDFIFGPPIGTYVDVVAFRAGEAINPDAIALRDDLRLGAINGYEYYGVVNDYMERHAGDPSLIQYMSGEDALEKILRKLIAGRLDMVAEVRAVLEYTLSTTGLGDQVDLSITETANEIFVAFSPVHPMSQTYAEQLTEGVDLLRENGRFDEILTKYGQVTD